MAVNHRAHHKARCIRADRLCFVGQGPVEVNQDLGRGGVGLWRDKQVECGGGHGEHHSPNDIELLARQGRQEFADIHEGAMVSHIPAPRAEHSHGVGRGQFSVLPNHCIILGISMTCCLSVLLAAFR